MDLKKFFQTGEEMGPGIETGGEGNSAASIFNAEGESPVLLVCEHASNHIPERYDGLGLSALERASHAAWDIGVLELARRVSELMDARLLAARVSRLVYDVNRSPERSDAIVEKSEAFDIPGNRGLSEVERQERARQFYDPFHQLLAQTASSCQAIVTIHSFTPVFMGKTRDVEIGVLHDTDSRLAKQLLEALPSYTDLRVFRNAPYGPEDGVTHTLELHGVRHGKLNAMIEIRNDLIDSVDRREIMARVLAAALARGLQASGVEVPGEIAV